MFLSVIKLIAQETDTTFFPKFISYSEDPIIDWNDLMVGSWADPTILKMNNEYIMYTSAMHGGVSTPEPISIYRFTSVDGYDWNMSPSTPILEPANGTYFQGGIETPNAVYFNGMYHMYNTVYLQNIPSLFKISHATSLDGINWIMDAEPALFPDSILNWMSKIVAEPGALVKNDTLYLFYTAIGFNGNVSIGLVRSVDGTTYFDTTQVVTIPNDIYPVSEGYLGVSTPDATLVGDTIYLFTDLVRTDQHTYWNQVCLHQFKSYGDINNWYYDTTNIHMSEDFNWTNGNYLSQLLGATPLMDGNRLRLWYWGYNLAEIELLDTTYHVNQVGPIAIPNPGHWGIGTSEYVFTNMANTSNLHLKNTPISINTYNNKGKVWVSNSSLSTLSIFSITGQLLFKNTFTETLNFNINHKGLVFIHVVNENSVITKKHISTN